ncbi:hypothetical protein C6568_10085 [Melaminivora suipulveris]|uniref:DUF2868 domain-containing protein n=1 Tax=Melaminivora suipulveris TaxID=2109913 RepID=A0A2R3QH13_9BURK|nr:hypothetical protein C6568_10085 [Melaminivora suipulveris]
MPLSEAQLRSVLLAQAIEGVDRGQVLVSAPEREAALHAAIAATQARGASRITLADVLLPRAGELAQRAAGREPAIAALHAGDTRWRWLARALPLVALALGLAADRVANAHRVDLLSPPLLLVPAWNLVVYASLAVQALRRGRAWSTGTAPRWLRAALARLPGRGRSLPARIAADFQTRWFAATPALQGARASRVLHLCAAAWGAGLALSLLLRGLVVRYQFGWESTFLDASQVHAIVRVLFAPLTALTGLAPFSLAEIAATQDFAGSGEAGGRWVWMYVGLLALVVVLPRVALAAVARWREARLARRCLLDLRAPEFDALRAALPAEVLVGVLGADAEQAAALAAVLALHQDTATPLEDHLRVVPADAPDTPVDVVLLPWAQVPKGEWPAAWQSAPDLALPWQAWGASWVLEPALPDALAATLPRHAAALRRLRQAWQARNEQRFQQATQLLARQLRACVPLPGAPDDPAARARHLQQLHAELRALHALPQLAAPAPAQPAARLPAAPAVPAPAPGRSAGEQLRTALGTSAGAAAGAAAGAKAGAMIDLGLGGLTLGAGTALGALLGGATAWTLQGLQKRSPGPDASPSPEPLRETARAACLLYLALAHQARMTPEALQALAARWPEQLERAITPRWPALREALQVPEPPGPLSALLEEVLREVLERNFPARGIT